MNRDEELSALLDDAVAGVDPEDRLAELRARTATTASPRRWFIVAGSAALATAAVITAIAVIGTDPTPTVRPLTPGPTDASGATQEPEEGPVSAVPAYFIGDTPAGPRLYREFQPVVSPAPGVAGLDLLEEGAVDPDYRSEWPAGSFDAISDPEAGVVHVELGDTAPADPSALALQQVVYTITAGFEEPLEIVFDRDGTSIAEASAAPPLQVLSLVNLTDPAEGQPVNGTLRVRGVANSFEANVLWTIESEDGSAGLGSFFTAEGYMGERLFPFSGQIDVSSLDPGSYTLIVETDDPSGGAEGPGAFSDTRSFVIE